MSINDEMEFRLRSEVNMSLNETEFRLRKTHELVERQDAKINELQATIEKIQQIINNHYNCGYDPYCTGFDELNDIIKKYNDPKR